MLPPPDGEVSGLGVSSLLILFQDVAMKTIPACPHLISRLRASFLALAALLVGWLTLSPCEANAQLPNPAYINSVEHCDLEGAHPLDPQKAGPGTRPSRLGEVVAKHCENAAYEHPGVPRFEYQRARAELWSYLRKNIHPVEALASLRALKERGYVAARYTLAQYYAVAGPYQQAHQEYEALWNSLEDPVGLLGLAYLHEQGKSVPKDPDQALRLYTQAADEGQFRAQTLLGMRYLNGQGVPQDGEKAAIYLLRAAEQGDPFAQTYAGFLYREGRGTAVDTAKSIEMFTLAADRPHWGNEQAIAQAELGFAYLEGKGVEQDDETAADYLWSARAKGHERAKLQGALMMAAGRGFRDGMEMARREISSLRIEAKQPMVKHAAAALFDEWCGGGRNMPDGCRSNPFTWPDLEPDKDQLRDAVLLVFLLGLFLDFEAGPVSDHTSECNNFSAFDPCSPVHAELANAFLHGWQ